jgi:hypothetical protein
MELRGGGEGTLRFRLPLPTHSRRWPCGREEGHGEDGGGGGSGRSGYGDEVGIEGAGKEAEDVERSGEREHELRVLLTSSSFSCTFPPSSISSKFSRASSAT